MRVLLIADTHGVLDERILERARGCDAVAHAGDIGSAEVLARLRDACAQIVAVRGNNDVAGKWLRRDHALLDALPETAVLELPGGTLAVVHGDAFSPGVRHRRLRERFADARAVVYGHSHRLCIDEDAMPWVLNPGAAGRARTYGGAG